MGLFACMRANMPCLVLDCGAESRWVRLDGRLDGWMQWVREWHGWMGGWMDGWKKLRAMDVVDGVDGRIGSMYAVRRESVVRTKTNDVHLALPLTSIKCPRTERTLVRPWDLALVHDVRRCLRCSVVARSRLGGRMAMRGMASG